MYICNVKAITINVSEPVYREFKKFATEHDRTTSELIREAMEDFLDRKLRTRTTLSDLGPVSLGKVLRSTTTRGRPTSARWSTASTSGWLCWGWSWAKPERPSYFPASGFLQSYPMFSGPRRVMAGLMSSGSRSGRFPMSRAVR